MQVFASLLDFTFLDFRFFFGRQDEHNIKNLTSCCFEEYLNLINS